MFTTVTIVRVHQNEYEKDFNAVAIFLSHYINKRAPTSSVKVASVGKNRAAKWQYFQGKNLVEEVI